MKKYRVHFLRSDAFIDWFSGHAMPNY